MLASVFKNFKLELGLELGTAYVCPAGTKEVVLGIQVANVDGVNEADASVLWTNASDSNAQTFLIKAAPVPSGSALGCLSSKPAPGSDASQLTNCLFSKR